MNTNNDPSLRAVFHGEPYETDPPVARDAKAFGENLRAEAGRLRFSFEKVAELLSYPHDMFIARIWGGYQLPEPDQVAAIASALGCSVERLTVSRDLLEAQLRLAAGLYRRSHEREIGLRRQVEKLEGALKGSRCKANVMQFLWQAAEDEMRSEEPVEVRLRKDLDDADQHAQKLGARVAELEAKNAKLVADIREWADEMATAYAEFGHEEEDWTPCLGGVEALEDILGGQA